MYKTEAHQSDRKDLRLKVNELSSSIQRSETTCMCFCIHLWRIKVRAVVAIDPEKHFRGRPTKCARILECTRIVWIVFTGLHRDVPVAKLLQYVSKVWEIVWIATLCLLCLRDVSCSYVMQLTTIQPFARASYSVENSCLRWPCGEGEKRAFARTGTGYSLHWLPGLWSGSCRKMFESLISRCSTSLH